MTAFTTDLATTIGQVRFEIGDTDPSRAKFTDAEISYAATGRSVIGAAAALCEVLATKYAEAADFDVDGAKVNLSALSRAYAERARRLWQRDGNTLGAIHATRVDGYTSGITSADNENSGAQNGQDENSLTSFDVGRWDE